MGKGFIPIFRLALFLVALIFVGGCDETGSGGSGSSDVLRGEPMILDSALAINVSNDRPEGITESFLSSDRSIYLWMLWANVEGRHTIEVEWFSPDQALNEPPFREDQEIFSSPTGEHIIWFFVDQPTGGFIKGEWRVQIFLDGFFERSHIFFVD